MTTFQGQNVTDSDYYNVLWNKRVRQGRTKGGGATRLQHPEHPKTEI
jgi:hypothetical protein